MSRHVQYNVIQNWNSLNTMTTDQYSSKSSTADSMAHNKPLFFFLHNIPILCTSFCRLGKMINSSGYKQLVFWC